MRIRPVVAVVLGMGLLASVGCEAEPGSERWCKNKAEEDRGEWVKASWDEYAGLCFEEGSKGWCEVLTEAPKDDWGLKDITKFALPCMLGGGDSEEEAEG